MLFLGALPVVRTQQFRYVIPFVEYNGTDSLHWMHGAPSIVTVFFQLMDPSLGKPTIDCNATFIEYDRFRPRFRPCEDTTTLFDFEVRVLFCISIRQSTNVSRYSDRSLAQSLGSQDSKKTRSYSVTIPYIPATPSFYLRKRQECSLTPFAIDCRRTIP